MSAPRGACGREGGMTGTVPAPARAAPDPGEASAELEVLAPLDLVATLRPLWRGPSDPTMRLTARSVARASHTPDGAGAMVIDLDGSPPTRALVRAWGPGARWLVDGAAAFLGLDDDPTGF